MGSGASLAGWDFRTASLIDLKGCFDGAPLAELAVSESEPAGRFGGTASRFLRGRNGLLIRWCGGAGFWAELQSGPFGE